MTFLKRHWPDLLISSLIVALLAGFALVFFGPNAPRAAETERARSEAAGSAPPTSPTTQAESVGKQPTAASTGADRETQQSGVQESGREASSDPAGTGESNTGDTEELPTIPSRNSEEAPSAEEAEESVEGPVISTPEITVTPVPAESVNPEPRDTQAPSTPAPSTPAPTSPTREGAAVATSRAGLPTRSDYRLSAGVFNNEAVARERTASITALGYQVHLIAVEQGVVAQVGPFADRDTAARAVSDIRRAFPAITLYSPVVRDDGRASPGASPGTSTPGAAASGTAAGSTASSPVAAPAREARSVPAGPVYLQVGAFDRQERAADMVSRLRAEGIAAEVNAPPGRKVRVLVGPFSGNALLSTEDKLRSLGVDHFRVQ